MAETDGLDHVTMREVGSRLGVSGMSIYKHVANKNDLLDAVVHAVLAQIEAPELANENWEQGLRSIAEALREGVMRYPSTAPLVLERLGTVAAMPLTDAGLEVLNHAGMDENASVLALRALMSFLIGALLNEIVITRTYERPRPRGEPRSLEREPHIAATSDALRFVSTQRDFQYGVDLIINALRAALHDSVASSAASAQIAGIAEKKDQC